MRSPYGFLSAYCAVIPLVFLFFFTFSFYLFLVFSGLVPITLLKYLKASISQMISVHTL